jgi:hypothetical protein
MHTAARAVLVIAGLLIAMGGLYDLFTPRLPPNLLAICGVNHRAQSLVRELLRALGGALTAIGLSVCFIVLTASPIPTQPQLGLILLLVLPAEGVNTLGMYRVGSPWRLPLAFALLTLVGVALAWQPERADSALRFQKNFQSKIQPTAYLG